MGEHKSTERSPARKFSKEFKRRVVEQSQVGGATVAIVARENGIREALLWRWRREYDAGKFDAPPEQVNFLPLGIQAPTDEHHVNRSNDSPMPSGYLELHLGSARVLIHGSPDRQTLANVIEALR